MLSDTEMVLRWAGDGAKNVAKRRRESGCPGYCTGEPLSIDIYWEHVSYFRVGKTDTDGAKMQCDEFPPGTNLPQAHTVPPRLTPPAATLDGGEGAHRMCISEYQNSRLQGPMMNCYRVFYDLQPGQEFVVRMGSCSGNTVKRHAAPESDPNVQPNGDNTLTMATNYSQWIVNPNTGNGGGIGSGFIIIPLGSVGAGTFSSKMAFSSLEGIGDLSIVDSEGSLYGTLNNPSTETSWDPTFDIYDDDTDLLVAGAAKQSVSSFSASFTATITASVTAATSSGAAETLRRVHQASIIGNGFLNVLLILWLFIGGLIFVL